MIAQGIYPDRKGKGGYKQEALVTDILNESYAAHNALDDVRALQKLFSKMKETSTDIYQKCLWSLPYALAKLEYQTK